MDNFCPSFTLFRSQPVMKDKRTNMDYRWPDTSQKQAVSKLGQFNS